MSASSRTIGGPEGYGPVKGDRDKFRLAVVLNRVLLKYPEMTMAQLLVECIPDGEDLYHFSDAKLRACVEACEKRLDASKAQARQAGQGLR